MEKQTTVFDFTMFSDNKCIQVMIVKRVLVIIRVKSFLGPIDLHLTHVKFCFIVNSS